MFGTLLFYDDFFLKCVYIRLLFSAGFQNQLEEVNQFSLIKHPKPSQ